MIDLHCHLLPGVDDGPADVPAAVALAEAHVAAGVTTVACTSHVDWNMRNTAEELARGVAGLRAQLNAAQVPLDIVAGAEIGLSLALDLPADELAALTLGGGPWLLIEAPLSPSVTYDVEQLVASVGGRGHPIVLAHPERSPAFQRDPDALRRLVDAGVILQLTATSLSGAFGSRVARFSRELVNGGLVQVLASDAHNVSTRPPGLRDPLHQAGLDHLAAHLTVDVPQAILAGTEIPSRPEPIEAPRASRSWWRRRGA